MAGKVRVLIVDDSVVVRSVLKELLTQDATIEVVGEACDPYVAREEIKRLDPDVLTLDVEMPRMDGITFLKNLMRLRPMPVVMLSTLTQASADITLQALELGAVDFMPKPSDQASDEALIEFSRQLCEKVKTAARVPVKKSTPPPAKANPEPLPIIPVALKHNRIIGIGSSTGGTVALLELLQQLPAQMPPILVTQHIPVGFTRRFAERLDQASALKVVEAEEGQEIRAGEVYIAPGDQHLRLRTQAGKRVVSLGHDDPVNRHRPSVEVMFDALAGSVRQPSQLVLIMLTGMGEDGAESMSRCHREGSFTIAQDEDSSLVWGMPGAVVKRHGADQVLPLKRIGMALISRLQTE